MAAVVFAMFNVEPGVFVANNPTNPAFFTKRWIQNLSATYEFFFLLDGSSGKHQHIEFLQ